MCIKVDEHSQKVDQMYGATQSASHTTRHSTSDIAKIIYYLLSEGTTKEQEGDEGSAFEDLRVLSSKKVSAGKLDDYLKGDIEFDYQQDTNTEYGEDDINYELYDVVYKNYQ